MQHRRQAADAATEASQLAELLECERELADLLSRVQSEAKQVVKQARADAAEAEVALEASLEAEVQLMRSRIRAETERRVEELLADARDRTARFEGSSDEDVERLADDAFRRLIGAMRRS